MKNKHILKVLSLLAALCIAAGCRGSTTAETTAGAGTQAETSTVSETTTAAESVSAEVEELEVDHVDEDGTVYYKDPTEWTTDKIFEALTINGQKFEAPLTIEKIGNEFDISEDSISYINEKKVLAAFLVSNEEEIGVVYLDNHSENEGYTRKEILYIHTSSIFMKGKDKVIDVFIGDIGIGTPEKSVVKSLGIPRNANYAEVDAYASYMYGGDNCSIHLICENGAVSDIHLTFKNYKKEN